MKLIGLISDTHIPARAKEIPRKVLEIFSETSFIVHAGDLTRLSVIEKLEQIAPVVAVYGNMDESEVRKRLPPFGLLKVFMWKIGVVHNPGLFLRRRKMRALVKENRLNVLVFGHTHRPFVKWEEGVLFINPGSPTNPLPPFTTRPTVALLKVSREGVKPRVIMV